MIFQYFHSLDLFSWQIISLLILAGFLTGIVNTFAGSGTVISYSLFMFLGAPVSIANGTVRMGVVLQTLAAAINFKKNNVLDVKKGILLGIAITLGSIAGAEIAISIDKDVFEKIVGAMMVVMLFFVIYKPERWLAEQKEIAKENPKWYHYIIYFLIGIYGGFIHIGVGIFLLAALVLVSGYDLVKANALKIFTVFLYSPFVLVVFILHDQVDYAMAIFSSIGNLIGGIIASHYAMRKGANFIRIILIIVIIVFSASLFGVFDYIF